jgi:hypothetical protein
MNQDMTRTWPLGQALTAQAPDLTGRTRQALDADHAALIYGFPPDPEGYIEFLETLGNPVSNYGSGTGNAAYSMHPSINVVRCATGLASGQRVQEQGGPLPPHTARAFSKTRPRYIAMLMANPGWSAPPGQVGESVIVRWSDVLRHMQQTSPDSYDEDYALLTGTPVTITATHVTDEWATTPLVFPLDDATGDGARWSLALWDQLPGMPMEPGLRSRYTAAARRFAQAADTPAVRSTHPLQGGEILILDNNWFGHGRLAFPRTRPDSRGGTELSPRELWSVVLNGPAS